MKEVYMIKKIIPCLDIFEGRVVKGVNFINLADAGDPVENAKAYCGAGADELAFLDITATTEGRKTVLDLVEKVARVVTVPFTVGGGIRTAKDFGDTLNAGADKVLINTSAVKNPDLINELKDKYGSERVVIAIDFRRNADSSGWDVYINGGTASANLDAVAWAREACARGAGTILPTSMDYDGTKDGYDIEATRAIKQAVNVPVIASGGAGCMEDFYKALTEGQSDAALAASLFHFREIDIMELKRYLAGRGVEVKI